MSSPIENGIIGPGPGGGLLVAHDDGSTWHYQGNSAAPYTPATEGGAPVDPTLQPAAAVTPGNPEGGATPEQVALAPAISSDMPPAAPLFSVQPPASPGLIPLTGVTQAELDKAHGSFGQPAPAPAAAPAPARSSGTPAQPAGPDDIDAATKAKGDATDAETAAKVAQQDAVGGLKNAQTLLMEKQAREQKEWETTQQAELQRRQADVDRAIDDAAHSKIDPEAWRKERTGGQLVAALLGQAIGSFSQAIGGSNPAEQMVRDAIKNNIDAQQVNLQQKNKTADAKGSALAHFVAATGDMRQARLATMEWSLKQAAQQVDALTAGTESDITKANGEKTKAGLLGDAAKLRMERAKLANETLATQAQVRASNAGARHMDAETDQVRAQMKYAADARASGALLPEQRERAVFRDGGRPPILVADAGEAKRLRPMVASADSTLGELDEAEQLAKEWGSSSGNTEAGAKYALKLDSIVKNINQSEGISQALQHEQIEMYKHALGNGTTTPTAATLAALRALRQSIQSSVNHQLVASGGQPVYALPTASARPGVK